MAREKLKGEAIWARVPIPVDLWVREEAAAAGVSPGILVSRWVVGAYNKRMALQAPRAGTLSGTNGGTSQAGAHPAGPKRLED
jgi:hypothetical protein